VYYKNERYTYLYLSPLSVQLLIMRQRVAVDQRASKASSIHQPVTLGWFELSSRRLIWVRVDFGFELVWVRVNWKAYGIYPSI